MDTIPNLQNVEQSVNDQSIFQGFQPLSNFEQNYQNLRMNDLITQPNYPFIMPHQSTPSIVSSASFESDESRDTYKHPHSPITSEAQHEMENNLYNQSIQPSLFSHLYPHHFSRLPASLNTQFNGTFLPFNNHPQLDSFYWMQQQIQQQHLTQYQKIQENNHLEYLPNDKAPNTDINETFVEFDYSPNIPQNTEYQNSTPQNSEGGSLNSDHESKTPCNKSNWYEIRQARLNNQKKMFTRTVETYRQVYKPSVRDQLEKDFQLTNYITIENRERIAKETGLSQRQVKTWFQNRRAKEKRQKNKVRNQDID